MDIITKFSSEGFRYYFLRECPFPGDGEFGWQRFRGLYNADLSNNLGNLYSRVVGLIGQNYAGHLDATAGLEPGQIYEEIDTQATARQVQQHIEACQYNLALQRIWQQILDPANRYVEKNEPWKLVKTDRAAARAVLYDLAEQLRVAAIFLKPFLPRSAETIYRSFNFPQPWQDVRHEDVWVHPRQGEDLRVLAALEGGKVKPLFPRIG
jgi:methionyl-tRNA synthetase